MLRLIRWLIGLALTLVVAIPILLLLTAVQPDPLVPVQTEPDPTAVARARTLLERYNPRRDPSPGLRRIVLSQPDLTTLTRAVLGQWGPAGAQIQLEDGRATVKASLEVPDNPLGRYVNLRLELAQVADGIQLDGLTLGRLEVPAPVAGWLGRIGHRMLADQPIYRDIADTLVAVQISPAALSLHYQWDPALVDRVKQDGAAALISDQDRERLLAQTARIGSFSRSLPAGEKVSAADLIGAVFDLAGERTADPADAATESRAALIALGLHMRGTDIPELLGVSDDARYRIRPMALRLGGREDFAQHFLISAGVAAAAGSGLADAVGLLKELDDSRGGSGFSFTDLAADRAGVRLTERATGPEAAEVQQLLAAGPDESLFLPEIGDLPEFMPEAEFVERFGGVGEPAYQRVTRQIEARIDALPVHR